MAVLAAVSALHISLGFKRKCKITGFVCCICHCLLLNSTNRIAALHNVILTSER